MKESDWKLFTKIKEKALERYCQLCLDEFKKAIEDESVPAHDRYLRHYQLVEDRDKKIVTLFDGHSRSKAWLQLLGIRSEGLADEALVAKLSPEFQEETKPNRSD